MGVFLSFGRTILPDLESYLPQRLFAVTTEQLVSYARLVLAAVALITVIIDPFPVGDNINLVLAIAAGFTAYSVVWLYFPIGARDSAVLQIIGHGLEIVCIWTLIYLSGGHNSPFLVLFTFCVLSATLRWGWRGAIATAVLLTLLFLLIVGVGSKGLPEERDEISRAVLRPINLLVIGIMLAYAGAYQERSRIRLTKLVRWPGPDIEQDTAVPIETSLSHAAELMCVPRVIIIWEQPDEPFREIVCWSKEEVRHKRERADRYGTVVSGSVRGSSFAIRAESRDGIAGLIDANFQQTFGIGDALVAPFQLSHCSGWVFMLDPSRNEGPDTLLLTELIAFRLGVDLENYLLRSERELAAASTERARLARDIHDGVLQGLAAADIYLSLTMSQVEAEAASKIDKVRQLIAAERRRVRAFVEATRAGTETALQAIQLHVQLDRLLSGLGRRWQCKVKLQVDPPDLRVSEGLAHNVRHLLAEALANAARHGEATILDIAARARGAHLELSIRDNGVGFSDLLGLYTHEELEALNAGPVSIRSRVKELGGAFSINSSPSGTELRIELPL